MNAQVSYKNGISPQHLHTVSTGFKSLGYLMIPSTIEMLYTYSHSTVLRNSDNKVYTSSAPTLIPLPASQEFQFKAG